MPDGSVLDSIRLETLNSRSHFPRKQVLENYDTSAGRRGSEEDGGESEAQNVPMHRGTELLMSITNEHLHRENTCLNTSECRKTPGGTDPRSKVSGALIVFFYCPTRSPHSRPTQLFRIDDCALLSNACSSDSGCYECSRRRINCDRGEPKCGKCVSKGLKCSGLGIRHPFNESIAARGRWAGKSI